MRVSVTRKHGLANSYLLSLGHPGVAAMVDSYREFYHQDPVSRTYADPAILDGIA